MVDLSERLVNLSPSQRKLLEERLKKNPKAAEPIAIVGMSCRFPGASNLDDYWRVIRDGIDATGVIPSWRWDVDNLYDPSGEENGKMSVKWAGTIDDVDKFDPMFFGISPREAARMDPQQRLLLEVAWEAFENAGIAPERMCGTSTGVFVGIGGTDYSKIPCQFDDYYTHIDAHVGTGNALSIAANRVSYILDLHGPSVAVDTACSSGTVGIHLAVQSLRNRECDAALAGGVNLILSPETTIAFSKARMLSPDGVCRPFDADANGYVRGEGCGLIVLKRLTDATRDGDNVLAIVRASTTNQDGRTSGITAPNGLSQQQVIRSAWSQGGMTGDRVNYIEAHGTGTPLGDPIEMDALSKLFPERRDGQEPCYVTSVKANIGHTETVSGIAGMIKVVLMMQHGSIPGQLHLNDLNPHLSLEGTRLRIPRESLAWPSNGLPRVAGVSSFGFGGTNTHVLIEEAVPKEIAGPSLDRPQHLLTISAKTPTAIENGATQLATYLDDHEHVSIADICHSANTGRTHFNHRVVITAADRKQLRDRLDAVSQGEKAKGVKAGQVNRAKAPKIAFLFTGQGSQYVGMGRELYETQPTFRQILQQCDEILREHLQRPLLSVLFPDPAVESPLDETAYTQPALFALEYALATLWQSWGIQPSVVLGHSVGEYVAATVAGVMSLEDGLHLIANRAALMQQLPRSGRMAVVFSDYIRVADVIAPHREKVSIAAANGPENTVISGDAKIVQSLVDEFEKAGIGTQLLTVSHAFHSPLMVPMLDEFELLASKVDFKPPEIPIVSNLTGEINANSAPDAIYWRDHIRNTVRFADSVQQFEGMEIDVLLEMGPTASLLGMARRCSTNLQSACLPSLRKGQKDWSVLFNSLAELYLLGAKVDWVGFDREWPRTRLRLPTYPFERNRYWFEQDSGTRRAFGGRENGPTVHPLLGSQLPSPIESTLFEGRLSSRFPKFMVDHQVQGSPVVPAAAFVEQGLAVAEQTFGDGPHVLENVVIQQAMFLPEGASRVVQITVSPETGGTCMYETHSVPGDSENPNSRWSLHACGNVRHGESVKDPATEKIDLDEVRGRVIDVKNRDEIYALIAKRGLAYGPAFQVLGDLQRTDNDSVSTVQLPESVMAELSQYHLHPALGDALFQAVAGIVPLEADGSYSPFTYMPVAVNRVRMLRPFEEQMLIYATRTSSDDQPSPETVEANVFLVDKSGNVLVEFLGVRVQRVGRQELGEREVDVSDWLYQIRWQPSPLEATSEQGADGAWLIFADQQGTGQALSAILAETGQRSVIVTAGDKFAAVAEGNGDAPIYRINPLKIDDYERVIKESLGAESPCCGGIVHLWSLDTLHPDESGKGLDVARDLGCGSVLQLIRQTARSGFEKPPSIWLATQGAQCLSDEQESVSVAQSPLWGLGRVAAMEHPELSCRLVDFEPGQDHDEIAKTLAVELTAGGGAEQIAYRHDRRYVARLQRTSELLEVGGEAGELRIPTDSSFRLRLGDAGRFDSLWFESNASQPPEAGQVELEVHATGLNFSDVLKAMGLYPGITDNVVPLGIECSGVVTAVGEGVDRFHIGDEVMGVVPYSFASHARTADYALVPKPKHVDHAEAATIPVTFLTAYYGLVHLARLQPGERVLIHAGAGGVGLAAIQIAKQIGAEVFATAGSDAKRDYLRSLGVEHVMNSRTLDFADEIMRITDREGVDVVLNSLPGDAITKSLQSLRGYGRFLEIGKTDIYQNRMIGLLPFQDNLSYFAIDLDRMLRQRPDYVRDLFAEVMKYFESGEYEALTATEFQLEQTIDAFRYMAARKNIGKVVVTLEHRGVEQRDAADAIDSSDALARGDGAYLITGGLGALGLRVAHWLADEGAGAVVLMSRRELTEASSDAITALESAGLKVACVRGDVTQRESLDDAIAAIPDDFPPLRGVIHAAGVLADGVLFDMDLEQLDKAMLPKVQGAWNLHSATRDAPLDFFVLFSSVACVIGSPGQGNYAAGNAFLDGLAQYRRANGLPATSINWGPWADAGMAAEVGRGEQIQSRGMDLISPEKGLQVLSGLVRGNVTSATVMDAHWGDMLKLLSGRAPALLSDIAEAEGGDDGSETDMVDHELRGKLLSADDDQRQALLREHFAEELARIMGIDATELDQVQPLNELGMDSLLAMELKNNLERRLAFTLPMAAFMESPSVTTLSAHASRALDGDAADAGSAVPTISIETWSPLVPLQPDGNGAPLFCIHPLGGDVGCYHALARYLPKDRPVYALRGRGGEGQLDPHTTIEEMADAYISTIRATQSVGPYHLAGWSAGGIFAYEVARRLGGASGEVGVLACFDTPLPTIYDDVDVDDEVRFLFDLGRFMNWFTGSEIDVQSIDYEELGSLDEESRWEMALAIAKQHNAVPDNASSDHLRRVVAAGRAHAMMIKRYEIKPCDQMFHLFRPAESDVLSKMTGQTLAEDLGWKAKVDDRMVLHTSPGDHFTMMHGTNAESLAGLLSDCLAEARDLESID